MRILLSGATGFLGISLRTAMLAQGHELLVLARKVIPPMEKSEQIIFWDGRTLGNWADSLETVDAVINLAGENIASRKWTKIQKEKIILSRLEATRVLVMALVRAQRKPSVFINASAVGYYGNVLSGPVTEKSPCGRGFLAETCAQWEKAALEAEDIGVRVVLPRIGPVLGKQGGMLSKMLLPYRFFLGGPLGSGKQWISWIHQDDVNQAFLYFLEQPSLSGAVNVVAPHPLPMKEFSFLLGRLLHRPSFFAIPSPMLRILMGEMATVVLDSAHVIPEKLLQKGFEFCYPDLQDALMSILHKKCSKP